MEAILQFKSLKSLHEIIVSDDKSSDQTVNIAKAQNVRVLEAIEKHSAIGANRNTAARIAVGEFLAFFDADSRIEDPNTFFDQAIKTFESHPEILAITGTFRVLPRLESLADKVVYTIFNIVHRLKNNVFHTGEAPGKFQMVRTSAFKQVNGYREDLISREDADLFRRLNKIGRTFCDRNLIIYHHGRRSKALGWPKLLIIWMRDTFRVATMNKSGSKEWFPFR